MEEQLDQIMAVMEEAFDPRWGEAWNRRQVRDALTTPNTHYLLAHIDGDTDQNPGSATGFLLSRAAPGEEEILLLAVRPEQRRSGVASRLVETFKAAAAVRGAERIFLEVRENNPAIAFYRLHHFYPVGRRRDYYRQIDGTRLDAITFAYNIDGKAD
jgi:ribosomal-protein-alanine N-acetyltransferase